MEREPEKGAQTYSSMIVDLPIVPLPDTTRKCGEIFLETVDRASGTSHLIGEFPR